MKLWMDQLNIYLYKKWKENHWTVVKHVAIFRFGHVLDYELRDKKTFSFNNQS